MIKIGINNDIFINTAAFEPENTRLRITFEENGGTKYASVFDRMNADEAVESLPTRDIMLFAPQEPDEKDGRGNKRTEEQKVNLINSNLTTLKAQLLHILTGYMTTADAKLNLYEGLNIDANNYNTQIVKKEVFLGVAKNMFTQFIVKMKPFFGDTSKLFRLLLVRQDVTNAYPTLRRKYINENPFWEPMEVKAEESKLKFTVYEIKDGLDNDLPVSKKDADKAGKSSGAADDKPLTAEGVFGA